MCDTVYSRAEGVRSAQMADWNPGVGQEGKVKCGEVLWLVGRDSEVLRAPRGPVKNPESLKKKKR